MKSIMKSILGLQMTAMFLTAALAGPAAAAQPVPFQGSVQAVESYDVQFPTLFVDAIGTAEVTHLGRFTVTYEVEVNLLTGGGPASIHLVAANGDAIFATGLGQGHPTEDPHVAFIVERYTITGGTGRFAGATGSFTLERQVSTVTGITEGSFNGTITFAMGH